MKQLAERMAEVRTVVDEAALKGATHGGLIALADAIDRLRAEPAPDPSERSVEAEGARFARSWAEAKLWGAFDMLDALRDQ